MGDADADYEYDQPTSNGDPDLKQRGPQSEQNYSSNGGTRKPRSNSLYGAVSDLISSIFNPDPDSGLGSASFCNRVGFSLRENLPHLKEASTSSGLEVMRWARQGSPLRLLLVISVGTITLLTLTGILVFLLFLAAATVNAIVISLFISLAAAGGFLAMFFTSVAFVYIGALTIAAFVISSVTISAVVTAFIVTGWIGFFFTVWLALKKTVGLAKHSVGMTGSALSALKSHRHRNIVTVETAGDT